VRSNPKFFYYLTGITLAGFLLRINHTWSESITADEVSALLRLNYDSLGAMIEGGVRPDGHPAFTQVLLWFWIKLFGNSEFAVRLPFVLMGTASIWFAGMAAKRWFGVGTALAVAASLAFLQFPLMYSQLARPYASGLFFTMWAACVASHFSGEEKVKWTHVLSFAIAAAGAAYSHYFSLLTTLLLGVSMIFLASANNRIKYFVSAVIAVVLFLPHWGISMSQLDKGGIGGPEGWLGPPTPAFFWDHIMKIFNSSQGMVCVVALIWVFCLVFNKQAIGKRRIFMLLIWVLPLAIGYWYSVTRNPVLQDSVLLFSMPFLFMFIFSWFPNDEEVKYPYRFANVLIVLFAFYITIYKPFRLTDHFGRLKELVTIYYEYADKEVTVIYNVDDPYFIDYHTEPGRTKSKHRPRFTFLEHDQFGADIEMAQLRDRVMHSQGDYFIYGWSTRASSPAALDIIALEYPCLVEKREWFNSAVYVFARSRIKPQDSCDYHSFIKFYSPMSIVPGDTTRSWHTTCNIVGDTFTLDSSCAFGPMMRARVGDVLSNPDNEIVLHASVFTPKLRTSCILVVEFMRDGEQLWWTGMDTKSQIDTTRIGWQVAYFGQRPPIPLMQSDSIHAYMYSPQMQEVKVRNLTFMTREGHRGIYGPRPDYK
jgi:hypothetical protein